jgi:hypothetical protein
MESSGIIEQGQGERAAAWAKAIISLRQCRNQQDEDVLNWIVHEATWLVPLVKKQPPATIFRYMSKGIRDLDRVKKFQREHIKPRKRAEAEIHAAATEAEVAQILQGLKVCAVTVDEHAMLKHGDTVDEWDRYRQAGIKVWDCTDRRWLW